MKVLKGIIIIIYIILGASFGIMLIPEILNDLGMNNHPIYTNHYVDGFNRDDCILSNIWVIY